MEKLLLINSSARVTRSITRHLTARFAATWTALFPAGQVISRDVGTNPPPLISESWISAAFAVSSDQNADTLRPLATSEMLIEELFSADAVAIGVPMYNFGMPAALKAYLDQIVRIGRTFAMDGSDPNWPYRPLIPSKPLIIITSAGASGYEPGGPAAHLNFLEPHLETVFKFVGFNDISLVRIGSEEHRGAHFERLLEETERMVDDIAQRLRTGKQAVHPKETSLS